MYKLDFEKITEEFAWHETGHVVVSFLHKIVPYGAVINPPLKGYTMYPALYLQMRGQLWDVLLAGHAWVMKFVGSEQCSLYDTSDNSDWSKLGMPSHETVETLTNALLERTKFMDGVSHEIHDMILKDKMVMGFGLDCAYARFRIGRRAECAEYERWFENEGTVLRKQCRLRDARELTGFFIHADLNFDSPWEYAEDTAELG